MSMSMSGNCPECSEFLGNRKDCECGYSETKKKSDSGYHDSRCGWINKSTQRRCAMMGTVTYNAGKQCFCTWHNVVMWGPEWDEDYQQFLGWREKIEREYPRTDWLPVDVAWRVVTGQAMQGRVTVREY